jgi:D-amino peptidase
VKIFVTVDLEGVAGYVQSDPRDVQVNRERVTDEANAAARGAFRGGAERVVIAEAHGNMRNLVPDRLDPRVEFISGQPKPLNHMVGVETGCDAALLIGYHAKAGTLKGVRAHTYASRLVYSLRCNGVEYGEIGVDAAIAGHFGVPVVMVSGDRAACAEARALLGDIVTVSVKDGISWTAAKSLHPRVALTRIEEGAYRSMARVSASQPFKIEPPVRVEVTFLLPSHADAVANLPFVERLDGRTVAFVGGDIRDAFELFNGLHFLAGVFA